MSFPQVTEISHTNHEVELGDFSRAEIITVMVPPYNGLIVVHWYANELNWPVPDKCWEFAVRYDHAEFTCSVTHEIVVNEALKTDPANYQALIDEIMESLLMVSGVRLVSHTQPVRT